MNKSMLQRLAAAVLFFALPASSWADLSNTASASFKDIANSTYNRTSNTVVVSVFVAPDIALTKSANPLNAKTGDTVTFTVAYVNNGGNANNVAITDAIPAGSTLVPGSISTGGSFASGTITWTIGTVAAGASGSVSFQVTVN